MICPKCHNRMKCMASNNLPDSMKTGRRYKCLNCGRRLYTLEEPASIETVHYILKQRWMN